MQGTPQHAYSSQDDPPKYPAWLYAAVHTGNPGDLDHYLRQCRGADSVLELGCGSGRIAAALNPGAQALIGIDRDPASVAAARAAGVDARVLDLRSFDLGQRFQRIIAPYNVLYCLLSEAELVACLRRICAHLEPDGEFLFDVYCADALHQVFDVSTFAPEAGPLEESDPEPIMRVSAGGREWDVFEESSWWPDQQRIDARFRHVPCDGSEILTAMIPQRYLLSGEVSGLLAAAGLGVRSWHGGFDATPFDTDSDLMVLSTAHLDQ